MGNSFFRAIRRSSIPAIHSTKTFLTTTAFNSTALSAAASARMHLISSPPSAATSRTTRLWTHTASRAKLTIAPTASTRSCADYSPVAFNDALVAPRTRTNISPRLDLGISAKNTLTVRYQYYDNGEQNQGVGQFSLDSQAYKSDSSENTLQISDTPDPQRQGHQRNTLPVPARFSQQKRRPPLHLRCKSPALKPLAAPVTSSAPTTPCTTSCRISPKSL